ncbi:MAG: hypothetical protein AAF865_14995 [Pseudomonadota bacterium]
MALDLKGFLQLLADWEPRQSIYAHWWFISRDGVVDDGSCDQKPTSPSGLVFLPTFNLSTYDDKARTGDTILEWLTAPLDQTKGVEVSAIPPTDEYKIPGDYRALPPDMTAEFPPLFLPVAAFAVNCDFEYGDDWVPEAPLPTVPRDTVIVGVIDTGIGLGNSRFRNAERKTRFLAAWQQSGVRPKDATEQAYLPFGTELYRDDIDALLAEHSPQGLHGPLDETSFTENAKLVDFLHRYGHRELGGRTAHGTHVLDLAAGFDPADTDATAADQRERTALIAVNLPHRDTYGLSGAFLDFFALLAIKRIAQLSDKIWLKSLPDDEKGPLPVLGFPIVINMSFGKNGGPKDGNAFFNRAFREMNRNRIRTGWAPVVLSVPVGNDNLERGTAVLELPPGDRCALPWRTLPEDQSANFLEIWTTSLPCEAECTPDEAPAPLAIAVAPPGEGPGEPEVLEHGDPVTFEDDAFDKPYAQLYPLVVVEEAGPGEPTKFRQCYVLCSAATLRHEPPITMAPSGNWTIVLENQGTEPLKIRLNVQTDQSTLPYAATGLRPIFDDPDYVRYSEQGRLRDSFRYPYQIGDDDLDCSGFTRRRGTLNDTASAKGGMVAIAGYRSSDGRPAVYSATGRGDEETPASGRHEPTVALPTDDAPAHLGRHASGAASGSVVALQGTSFATAAATRLLAEHYLRKGASRLFDPNAYLETLAIGHELGAWPDSKAAPAKVGKGRLPSVERPRITRLTPGG